MACKLLFCRSFLNAAIFSAFRVETGSLFQVLALMLATLRSCALHFDFTTRDTSTVTVALGQVAKSVEDGLQVWRLGVWFPVMSNQ